MGEALALHAVETVCGTYSPSPDRAQPPGGNLAGAVLGSFRLLEARSRGGFATIYRGRHLVTGGLAAVKVLHNNWITSGEHIHRFYREARTLAMLEHPALPDVYEFGEVVPGWPYMAIEWLEGQDLEDWIRSSGPVSAPEAVAVLEDVLGALHTAHSAGVIHRDVKAKNVMLLEDGRIKLVDFGIAKLDPSLHNTRCLTRSAETVGTVANMAPEQIRGQPLDARADIYAAGVLLFQLLTGRRPFCGRSAAEIQDKQLFTSPPSVSQYVHVPPELECLVARCLAKDKEARPDTARALIDELRAALRRPMPQRRAEVHLKAFVRLDLVDLDTPDQNWDLADDWFSSVIAGLERIGLDVVAETDNSAELHLSCSNSAVAHDVRQQVLGLAQAFPCQAGGLACTVDCDIYIV